MFQYGLGLGTAPDLGLFGVRELAPALQIHAMPKEAVFTMKLELELRDQFMAETEEL